MDFSTDNVNHISYIGLIMYYVSGAEGAILNKESIMIGFSAFCEKHTTVNINRWFLEMLNKYDINNNNYTIITDCGSNMIALLREHSLVVCFTHRLHTVIATSFTKTKETDKLLLNINRTITDIIIFVKRTSN